MFWREKNGERKKEREEERGRDLSPAPACEAQRFVEDAFDALVNFARQQTLCALRTDQSFRRIASRNGSTASQDSTARGMDESC
eukprot:345645-Rhodomonas_salina.3